MCWYGATISSASCFHPLDDIGNVTDVYERDSYNEKRCDFKEEINPVVSHVAN